MSWVVWDDKGRFRKLHAAEPGHQHTACSLWLEWSPINGLRFPPFTDDPEYCQRCLSKLRRLVRDAA